MKTKHEQRLIAAALTVALSAASLPLTGQAAPYDAGWPRVLQQDGKRLTVYQPQVDYWNGYTNLQFRCVIAVGTTKDFKTPLHVTLENVQTGDEIEHY